MSSFEVDCVQTIFHFVCMCVCLFMYVNLWLSALVERCKNRISQKLLQQNITMLFFYTYSNDGLMQQIDTFDQQDGKHNGFCVLDNTIDFESPASVILDENNLAQYSGTYH